MNTHPSIWLRRAGDSQRRPGYTFIELVVSMVSSTLLVAGLSSTLYISSWALNNENSAARQSSVAAEVLADMMADLRHAQTFSERTATAVTFTVPDRDGDTLAETVRYAWSGTPGDPLTYQYNGGNVKTLASNVQAFSFNSRTRLLLASGAASSTTPQVVFEEFTEKKAGADVSSLSIDLPAGTVAGDLLIAAVATDGDTLASLAPPPGWNVVNIGQESSQVTFGVWWRLADITEPATYPFTWSTAEQAYGWIMRFTGHDPAGPIHAVASAGGKASTPTSSGVTTTVDNALILRLGGFNDRKIVVDSPGLVGHTPVTMDESNSSGETASGGAGYHTQPSAGTGGDATFSLTKSKEFRTVTIAIAPDSGN